jgi:flagellum-specific peptidoglycan hydrolase FlgJ
MFKNIISILFLVFIVACSSKQQVVVAPSPKPIPKKVAVMPKKTETVVVSAKPKETASSSNINNNSQVLEATSKVKVTNQMVLDYIQKYKEIAKNSMKQFGVPASITLSQALLESGSGTGSLCQQANNHFGIKCRKDWTGPSVKYDDDEAQECFRKYANPNDSFKDHSAFLLSKPWYAKLFKLDVKDYKAWAKGLKSAGYATDPQYPQKLINLIEKYKLFEIDNEVKPNAIVIIEEDLEVVQETKTQTDVVEDVAISDNQNLYTVQPKDTMYSLSKKFNISVDELKSINNLTENGLSIGQNLKISK